MGKFKALLVVLQKGSMVADPAQWKNRQISASIITALLWAVLNLAGLDETIGSETVDAVAVGALALVNWVLTLATTDKIGLQPKR